MAGICKSVVRFGVIGGLATGALVLIAGPHRVHALIQQGRDTVNDVIDSNITDPVALRAKLRQLEEEYPRRIEQVEGDLAQLQTQKAQLNRELRIAEAVVELTERDHAQISAALDRLDGERIRLASTAEDDRQYVLVIDEQRLSPEAARSRSEQILATKAANAAKAADLEKHLAYLGQQEERFSELLSKLKSEQTQFRAQLFDLDRQVDAVARNERMIDVMKGRQKTLDEQGSYRAASLGQFQQSVAARLAQQEATLASLAQNQAVTNYEQQAAQIVDRPGATKALTVPVKPTKRVIEILPESPTEADRDAEKTGPVAAR
jgi:chromosome segregation ATPase